MFVPFEYFSILLKILNNEYIFCNNVNEKNDEKVKLINMKLVILFSEHISQQGMFDAYIT